MGFSSSQKDFKGITVEREHLVDAIDVLVDLRIRQPFRITTADGRRILILFDSPVVSAAHIARLKKALGDKGVTFPQS